MADNVAITAGSGTTVATDDVAGVHYQKVKVAVGAADAATLISAGAGAADAGTIRVTVDTGQVAALGQAASAASMPVVVASDQTAIRQANKAFAVAATTLTRPANTTQYAAGDSISNHGTAGSVTALSATVSDTNDAPIVVTHIEIDTTDTGIGAATTTLRVYLYNSDPTASSGVVAGDNAAFSNKKAGLVGTFTGAFTAMSDGGKAILVPETGAPFLACKPASGAATLYVQHQIVSGTPTPSANSTTLISTICGFQARA